MSQLQKIIRISVDRKAISLMAAKTTHSSSKLHLHGTVLGFNLNPKGHIDGALVETSNGPAQLNFPKHTADVLARAMHAGSTVDVHVELETEVNGRSVFRVCDEESQASGQIVQLNYALQGAINGYRLEDGTFLHCGPHGAERYDLHVGETVKATGTRREGPDAVVMEVRTIMKITRLGKRHDDPTPG